MPLCVGQTVVGCLCQSPGEWDPPAATAQLWEWRAFLWLPTWWQKAKTGWLLNRHSGGVQDRALPGTAASWVRSLKRQKKCWFQNYLTENRTQHWCHWDGTGNYAHVRLPKAFIDVGGWWDGGGTLGDSRWSWQLYLLIAVDLLSGNNFQ